MTASAPAGPSTASALPSLGPYGPSAPRTTARLRSALTGGASPQAVPPTTECLRKAPLYGRDERP